MTSLWRPAAILAFYFSIAAGIAPLAVAEDEPYDPLVIPSGDITTHDLTFEDKQREREIPVRVYLPRDAAPVPVVLFSHGLGGARENNPYLGQHWAARGYVVVFMQHAGSDNTVWKDTPPARRMAALQQAAGLQSFLDRVRDVPAVIDQLGEWNHEEGHPLSRRMNLDRVGMSGHSFGAITTQAVSGQRFGPRALYTDERIDAAVAYSPSVPRRGNPQRSFGQVRIPWMLLTGTHDDSPIGNATIQSRQEVFPALPAGDKYELVLDGAEHSAFSDRPLPGDRQPRNANHHRAILAVTTAFWDAYLQDNAAAREWLAGDDPANILEAKDRWQRK